MDEFNSIEELYKRLLPALKSKLKDFKNNNIDYITDVNIWEYLSNNKWKSSINLSLSDMVSDILNANIFEVEKYVKEKLKADNEEII